MTQHYMHFIILSYTYHTCGVSCKSMKQCILLQSFETSTVQVSYDVCVDTFSLKNIDP